MAEKKKVNKVKKEVKKLDINKEEVILDLKNDLTNKIKNQITKEVIDDMKKDVSSLVREDIKKDIESQINNEIRKANKRVLRGRRGKIFRRDIVIIVLLIFIGYLFYFMYNHNYVNFSINSNMNNNIIINDKKNVSKKEDYSYLLDMVNIKLPFDNNSSLYLYAGNYNEKNINSSIKLTLAYNYILKDEFTKEEMKEAYIKLFGTDKNYQDVSFDYECKHFKYDETYKLISDECMNISSKEIVEKIINISNKKDKVVITTVVGVYDNSDKSLYNYKNIYDAVAVNLNSNFDISSYQKKLNTYEYTFINNNGEYYFDSIKKL